MILVMGASSSIGQELVKRLSSKGAEFRAGYRTPAQAADAEKQGVAPVLLDYAEPDTLKAALDGADKLFVVSPPRPNLEELETNVVDAAKDAGIKHFVKLSVWGAEGGEFKFARDHRAVEKKIEASGLPHTFLRANGFMQNMLTSAASIKSQGAFYLPAGDARVSEIDVRDIASVAAAVLTEPGYEGAAYELGGPEALSNNDRAGILSEVLGKPISYVSLPDVEWKAAAMAAGLPEWSANGIIELMHYYKEGKAEAVSPAVEQVTGKKPISFRQFVEDNAGAWR
jgi:uncharacterized protein YbjT (DUF2867 family)